MTEKVTPKKMVKCLKWIVFFSFMWPPPKNASKFQVKCFKIIHLFACLNMSILGITLMYTIYDNDYDISTVMQLWVILPATIRTVFELIASALEYDRIQYVIKEMEDNIYSEKPSEKLIYQKYIDKCKLFYGSTVASDVFGGIMTIIGPLLTPDHTFPTDTKYPFDVTHEPMRTIIYLHQIVATCQSFSMLCNSYYAAFFIWFIAARFEILSEELRTVTDKHGFNACVQQHIKLIRYTEDIIVALRLIILSKIIFGTWAIITCGLVVISQSTLMDKVHFAILALVGFIEIYSYAWPADHLIEMSINVAQAIYDSTWYNQDKIFQKDVCFILQRSQIPITINVSIFPAISLEFFSAQVSTLFSYLMTLRIMFVDDN